MSELDENYLGECNKKQITFKCLVYFVFSVEWTLRRCYKSLYIKFTPFFNLAIRSTQFSPRFQIIIKIIVAHIVAYSASRLEQFFEDNSKKRSAKRSHLILWFACCILFWVSVLKNKDANTIGWLRIDSLHGFRWFWVRNWCSYSNQNWLMRNNFRSYCNIRAPVYKSGA